MPVRWNGWLIASVVLGASYWLVAGLPSHGPLLVAWKGSGVALLAVVALVGAMQNLAIAREAGLVAAVMALGAAGDVSIEFSLTVGAAFFLAGHAIAIVLYGSNLRPSKTVAERTIAAAILVLVPFIAWALPADRHSTLTVAIYASGLAGMAAMAWISRFPHDRVALGALMFVASDLLIFARMGPLAESVIPRLLVWPLYYGGQFHICTGVLASLSRRSEV